MYLPSDIRNFCIKLGSFPSANISALRSSLIRLMFCSLSSNLSIFCLSFSRAFSFHLTKKFFFFSGTSARAAPLSSAFSSETSDVPSFGASSVSWPSAASLFSTAPPFSEFSFSSDSVSFVSLVSVMSAVSVMSSVFPAFSAPSESTLSSAEAFCEGASSVICSPASSGPESSSFISPSVC